MKKYHPLYSLLLLSGLTMVLTEHNAYSEDQVSATDSTVYKAQNPLTPMYSLPLNYTYHGGAADGGVSIGSLQPIIPIKFDNWNLINQLSLNFIGTTGNVTGIAELPQPYPGSGVAGLADTNFTSLITPANPGSVSWGVGPTFVFPTDALIPDINDRRSRELGSGKFSMGPAFMLVTQPKPWSLGLKAKQVWSVLGSDSRESVSQMVVQPFINYNLADNWYLVSDMDMIANWNYGNDQRWTVPVGGGVGKLFKFGKHGINTKVEGYYNPVRPDNAPEWSANFTLQYLFVDQ
jgi:hypothetical protein